MYNLANGVYFISGIDTDIGKSYATGFLAKKLSPHKRIITQKLVQTGSDGFAADIATHRQLMGITPNKWDNIGVTMPVQLRYPASPHLAARLEGINIDWQQVKRSTDQLAYNYDIVLVEGVGGLCVPLYMEANGRPFLLIDYIAKHHYPVILVSSGRLGSINHTLLSLSALQHYGITLTALIYNAVHDSQDKYIAQDTKAFLADYLTQNWHGAKFWEMGVL